MAKRSVDLPHPLGPTIASRSWAGIVRSVSSSASTSPNRWRTPPMTMSEVTRSFSLSVATAA